MRFLPIAAFRPTVEFLDRFLTTQPIDPVLFLPNHIETGRGSGKRAAIYSIDDRDLNDELFATNEC